MQHSEDNPNQIRILAQTLTDGGVMDELINEELGHLILVGENYMKRYGRWSEKKNLKINLHKCLANTFMHLRQNEEYFKY